MCSVAASSGRCSRRFRHARARREARFARVEERQGHAWVKKNGGPRVAGTFADTAAFGESSCSDAVGRHRERAQARRPENFAGKVVSTRRTRSCSSRIHAPAGDRSHRLGRREGPAMGIRARVVKASTPSATRSWSIRSSRADRPTCSSAATTRRRRPRSPRSATTSAGRRSTSAGSRPHACSSRCASLGDLWHSHRRVGPRVQDASRVGTA